MEWIAHRGAKTEFPENTIAAFVRAFERGADAIELDVHATADGEVVVHHDPDVVGPAARHGSVRRRLAIAQSTLDDLRMARDDPEDQQIPTLAGVLALVPPGRTVYVEIKGAGMELAVADVLARSSARTAVHSFDHAAIARMRALAPDVPRGILFDRRPRDITAAMHAAAARDVWPDAMIVDRPLVDAVHAAGGRVIVWTVNHPSEARRLIALGVDGICTDDVRLQAALRQ